MTFDRKLKKDAFYLYKAAWNRSEPFVHICGSRYVDRPEPVTEIKVYSNREKVSLYVDGHLFADKEGRTVFRFQVPITGEHTVEARSGEACSVILVRKVAEANPDYVFNRQTAGVANWFDREETDPAYFSVADTLGELRASPEAGPVIERIMAQGLPPEGTWRKA